MGHCPLACVGARVRACVQVCYARVHLCGKVMLCVTVACAFAQNTTLVSFHKALTVGLQTDL